MKNLLIMLIVSCIIILMVSFDALFILSEKERGVILRFGQLIDANVSPGLHAKLPFMDKLYRFDARLQSLSLPSARFLTKEKKAVIVDAYVKWKIINVPVFYRSTSGDLFRANTLLSQRIESSLRDKFGSLTLIDVVSGQRDELMEEITHSIAEKTEEALGIKVQDVRVKQIDLPQSVSESVFNRMNSEREKEAREYRAQGKESANIIEAEANKKSQIIVANAKRLADINRGEGDAEATRIYAKTYGKNENFFSFYQSLKTYQESFNQTSDLVILNSNNPFFKYFTGDMK